MQQQDLPAIGSRIKSIRENEGILAKDMAAEVGIAKKTLSQVENGHTKPPQLLLSHLSVKLKYNIDWILTGRGKHRQAAGKALTLPELHSKVVKMETDIRQLKELVSEVLAKLK